MRERVTAFAPFPAIGVAGGVLGLCCGLPVLFSLGVLGAVAGLSVLSWALIGVGLALAALGWARWVRRRRSTSPAATGHPRTSDLAPDRSMVTTEGHRL